MDDEFLVPFPAPDQAIAELFAAIEKANAEIRTRFAIDLPPARSLTTLDERRIIALFERHLSLPTPNPYTGNRR